MSVDVGSDATLIIAPGWIGDTMMAQGLLARLKTLRDTPIDVLSPAPFVPLIERMSEVRTALVTPFEHGDFALAQRIKFGRSLKGRYSRAYVLPGSWKSAVVPFAAGIGKRTGYLREQRWGLLNDIRTFPRELKRNTARLYQALETPDLLTKPGELVRPRLRIDEANRTRLLAAYHLDQPFVALIPGAGFGSAKRWPPAHWAQLATRLSKCGLLPVVLGAVSDRETATEIVSAGAPIRDLTGKTGLADVVDLVSAARAVVANDTGLMHIAAAVGVPVAVVYGSTSPRDTPPLSDRAAIVSLALPCSPCHQRTCPLGHHACMRDLTPERVAAALELLLADQ